MKTWILAAVSSLAFITAANAVDSAPKEDGKGKHKRPDMFKQMDANEDGAVTKAEAAAFHAKRFEKMDADGDGKITKDEAEAMHKKRMERREKYKEGKHKGEKHNGEHVEHDKVAPPKPE